MIEKKKDNGHYCVPRSACIAPKIDKATLKYLEDNPEISFSKLVCISLREKLIKEGYYSAV
jgi:hypothetical protein